MRKWIIAVATLLAVPMVGAAAVVYAPVEPEQLVEGHTVFTVITVRNGTTPPSNEQFAAAVAVLVRENIREITYKERFPGVLWFNDQYLVNPSGPKPDDVNAKFTRYPCGAVIAVNAGDPLPTANNVPVVPPTATYIESYHITDPNDRVWDVDKWNYDPDADGTTPNGFLIWSVAVGNNQANYGQPDNGVASCGVLADSSNGCDLTLLPFTDDTPLLGYERDEVYRDNRSTSVADTNHEGRSQCLLRNDNGPVLYNAVLFFFLNDLTDFAGVKNHAAAPDSLDSSGCQPGYAAWPCVGNDDTNEGNSHRFGGASAYPQSVSDGRNNHGGSTGCGAGNLGGGPQYQHAVCNIDIYFGYRANTMPVRSYRVFDAEGQTAPYHCHETNPRCNEEDIAPGTL